MRSDEPENDLETLLDFLRRSRGFDFTGYKRTGLSRRVDKRMQAVGIDDYLSYLNYLKVVPDEFTQLFNTILINVTSFFRARRPGSTSPRRSSPASSTARSRTSRSASGAPAAPPERSRTPWPWWPPRHSAWTRSVNGSRSTPPTSTRRR